jgi:hypothetical protein
MNSVSESTTQNRIVCIVVKLLVVAVDACYCSVTLQLPAG